MIELFRSSTTFNLRPLISPSPMSLQPLCVVASSPANGPGPASRRLSDCQRCLAQTSSRCLGTHAATVWVTRLRTTYDGGTSVVRRSRALSPTGRLSRRHQMTVLELIIVALHCRKDGRVGLCVFVFVQDNVRYVER